MGQTEGEEYLIKNKEGIAMILFNVFLSITVVCFVISGLSLGVWTSGDRGRANFYGETKEHRSFREKLSLWSGLLGVVFLIVTIIFYLISW